MGDAVTLGNTFLATINEILSHLCTGDIVTIHFVSCNMLWDKLLQVANQWAMYTLSLLFSTNMFWGLPIVCLQISHYAVGINHILSSLSFTVKRLC